MPGLVRNIVIFAAVSGLILQPASSQRRPRGNQHEGAIPLGVLIDYESHAISRRLKGKSEDVESSEQFRDSKKLEVFGIIGKYQLLWLLKLTSNAYLIAITKCEEVARIFRKPVYVITDIAAIPLQSQTDAEEEILRVSSASALAPTRPEKSSGKGLDVSSRRGGAYGVEENAIEEEDRYDTLASLEDAWLDEQVSHGWRSAEGADDALTKRRRSEPSIAEDVITRRGLNGRWARWPSSRGLGFAQRLHKGATSSESESLTSPNHHRSKSAAYALPTTTTNEERFKEGGVEASKLINSVEEAVQSSSEADVGDVAKAVTTKVLETARLLLTSKTFFFSYDVDLSRNIASQNTGSFGLPLSRQFDPQYFWNAHLAYPFTSTKSDEYILPLTHGFIGQRVLEHTATTESRPQPATQEKLSESETSNDPKCHLLTLISRKSNHRAGLRYLRRGIDPRGHVANGVETEQMLSSPSWDDRGMFTFLQTRGSLPLYFSQSSYTFKPVPQLHGSLDTNRDAFRRHFHALSELYGDVQAVNLLNRHGGEAAIGELYDKQASALNAAGGIDGKGKQLRFEWFDFHAACRGMKFENVSILVNTLIPFLETSGWSTVDPTTGSVKQRQIGIVRTNCMDCLDRTNVAQASLAQHVLARQLSSLSNQASPEPQQLATSTAFNTLWADNGDALSVAYAGTSALKGDFTRTHRRTPFGLLTDLSLTLHRFQRNLFEDGFAQVVVDYLMGAVGSSAFGEYAERGDAGDVGLNGFWDGVRRRAVEKAASEVVDNNNNVSHSADSPAEPQAHALNGWVLSTPASTSSSSAAAPPPPTPPDPTHNTAKNLPHHHLRAQPLADTILLLTPTALHLATYDFSAERVRSSRAIPLRNVRRVRWGKYVTETRSARQVDAGRNVGFVVDYCADGGEGGRVVAFKARYGSRPRGSMGKRGMMRERDFVSEVVSKIADAARSNHEREADDSGTRPPEGDAGNLLIEEADILSAESARRNTTWLEELEWSFRKMLWG